MNWSIQKKILILTIGLSIFTASVIFLFYSYKTTAVQNSNKKQNLLVQSNLIQATIDRFLQERLSDVLDLAQDSVLCSAQVSSIDARIKSYISAHSYFESISVFDTGRVRLADTKDLEIGKQHSLITYWRRLPESSYVVDISRSESMKINVIHFGCKIYKNGRHVGYLVARMDAQKVNEIFNYVLQKENQFINIELLDSNGTTLFSNSHPSFSEEAEHFEMKAAEENQLIETNNSFVSVQRLNGYKNYPGNNWHLILSIDKKNLLYDNSNFTYFLVTVSLTTLLIVSVIALIFARVLVRPIEILSDAAQKYGDGELRHNFHIATKDEFQFLGKKISIMASKLREKIEVMEDLNEEMRQNLNTVYEQKQYILTQNQRINNGLNIAQTFQKSLLPDITNHSETESKILFRIYNKPKLKVCSDFYFIKSVEEDNEQLNITALISCAKQGLSGAFVTIIANNLLTQIVEIEKQYCPNKIVSEMDKRLYQMFSKHQKNNFGLTIGVIVINSTKDQFAYFGAAQNMIEVNQSGIKEHKGGKDHLGSLKYKDTTEVEMHPIRADINMYMVNKGFEKQIGGPNNKKFLNSRVLEVLKRNQHFHIDYSVNNLQQEIEEWSTEEEQDDDYLIIALGYKLQGKPIPVLQK